MITELLPKDSRLRGQQCPRPDKEYRHPRRKGGTVIIAASSLPDIFRTAVNLEGTVLGAGGVRAAMSHSRERAECVVKRDRATIVEIGRMIDIVATPQNVIPRIIQGPR